MRADFFNIPADGAQATPECAIEPFDTASPARFLSRELSWLAFNSRVLEEAQNPAQPLMERVRFLSISASNLDEFFMVRIAGLRGLVRDGVEGAGIDGRTPAEQLAAADANCRQLMKTQQQIWAELKAELARARVEIVAAEQITAEERAGLADHFLQNLFPVLTPLAIDPAHPFPFIPNRGMALAMQLRPTAGGERIDALVPIPSQVARFAPMHAPPQRSGRGEEPPALRFCASETLIELFLNRIFPGYELESRTMFRLLRDSDLELEEEAEDLVAYFERALKRRRRGDVVRLKIQAGAPAELADMLIAKLNVTPAEIYEVSGVIGVGDLDQLVDDKARPDLCWRPYAPRWPERVKDFAGDVFKAIRQKDMLIQHPYESFSVVARFLEQAAQDPNVVAIRQTLYRTPTDGPIVDALVEAAEAGKSVTALVELKARFDEAANIQLSKRLERAGAQVIYGFVDLKTHAKMSAVVRREDGKLVTYCHFGTGNYHPITAQHYTDLSLFTCDAALGRDAVRLFNYVSSYARPVDMEALDYAPVTLKRTLLRGLAAEVENARAGRPAHVWAKMNALIEPQVIDALYAASQAGVRIDLVIRGVCGVRPGVPGFSETIRVKSIVGRFLEHSRIVCFGNGGWLPGPKAKVWISSADWMDRNLKRRVETLCPILNETVRTQILEQVMPANLMDEAQSWVLQPDGTYVRAAPPEGVDPFNSHTFFMANPSLSGRGTQGADDAPRLRPRDTPRPQPQTKPKPKPKEKAAAAKTKTAKRKRAKSQRPKDG